MSYFRDVDKNQLAAGNPGNDSDCGVRKLYLCERWALPIGVAMAALGFASRLIRRQSFQQLLDSAHEAGISSDGMDAASFESSLRFGYYLGIASSAVPFIILAVALIALTRRAERRAVEEYLPRVAPQPWLSWTTLVIVSVACVWRFAMVVLQVSGLAALVLLAVGFAVCCLINFLVVKPQDLLNPLTWWQRALPLVAGIIVVAVMFTDVVKSAGAALGISA